SARRFLLHVRRPLLEARPDRRYTRNEGGYATGTGFGDDEMNAHPKPLAEVTHVAVQELINKVGIVDTIRFLNQFSTGYGDYTKERDQLFRDLTLDELLGAMGG